MADENKRNLKYFEAPSMRELFEQLQTWQEETNTRLLSLSVERDGLNFCCIALTNPMEVVICRGLEHYQARVTASGCLEVNTGML